MSILDGFSTVSPKPEILAETIRRGIDAARRTMSPDAGELLALMAEGLTLAEITGIGEPHREALFQLGCRLMICDAPDQAEAIFLMLTLLDPLEARAHYGAGMAMQARGNLQGAAQCFLQFLTLDATNPDGYLRLGECLMEAGEIGNARDAFLCARTLAENGHGKKAHIDEVKRQIGLISRR